MSPIQQMLLGVGAVATKTYVDDIFSTFLYAGTGSARSINNGINLSGEGGMVWTKTRTGTHWHMVSDTARGVHKAIYTNSNIAEQNDSTKLTAFNADGFSLGTDTDGNASGQDFASWTFRKASGFFDVVTWTGNGAVGGRNINHSLSSIPGCVIVKCTSESQDWAVYHRGVGTSGKYLSLNDTDAATTDFNVWNNNPTSTYFSIGSSDKVNKNNATYVAYLFAGGESTATTARSVDFDGSNDYLEISSHADLQLGTGDFTLEMWWNGSPSGTYTQCFGTQSVFAAENGTWRVGTRFNSQNRVYFARGNGGSFDEFYYDVNVNDGQWHHIACVRASNIVTIYIDGIAQGTPDGKSSSVPANRSITGTCSSNEDFWVSRNARGEPYTEGKMSNIRVVKGTAVYTSSFRPSTAPLANITNTVLLICNNSSVTGSTVTPGTISSGGSPTASTDSPFDDPAGFVFGDAEDQNVIKCGSYIGNGSTDGPEIFLGFEPQWVMLKNASSTGNWFMFDTMRGIVTGANDARLLANSNNAEYTQSDGTYIDLTSTGFKLTSASSHINGNGNTIIYCAIRRPDGYVGKPVELGTGAFAMDTGNSSSTQSFTSGFPVDFALVKLTSSSGNWDATGRLIQGKYLRPNTTDSEGTWADYKFDQQDGFGTDSGFTSSTQSWMWKRGHGFDCICYKGNGSNTGDTQSIPHGLNQIPEMAWIKKRSASDDWIVYNKDLHSSIPEKYYLELNDTTARTYQDQIFDIPTSTHFNLRHTSTVNQNNQDFIMILFSSVSGISKVGSYTGSASTITITTGFQPRFLFLKNITLGTGTKGWYTVDTTRGWASGNDQWLRLDSNVEQGPYDFGAPTSTGFTLTGSNSDINDSGSSYIYYAHA